MSRFLIAAALLTGAAAFASSPWVSQTSPTTERLRGVSAASDTVAWASGNKGTVVRTVDGGATRARVYRSADQGLTWDVSDTPIMAGNASSGVFSLAFNDANHGIAVGGDYRLERESGDNLAITNDGGRTWAFAGATRLRSFRSAVAYVPGSKGRRLIAALH